MQPLCQSANPPKSAIGAARGVTLVPFFVPAGSMLDCEGLKRVRFRSKKSGATLSHDPHHLFRGEKRGILPQEGVTSNSQLVKSSFVLVAYHVFVCNFMIGLAPDRLPVLP